MLRPLAVATVCAAFSLGCAAAPTARLATAPSTALQAPSLPPGCDSETYHRLDFWLGTWDVTGKDGQYEGTNFVVPSLNRCAIEEHWIDARGHRGDSLFYVDRPSASWRQVWVTDEGPNKEKRELLGAVPGAIRFEGDIDRTTLTPRADGTVSQLIEGKQGSWEGIYKRLPKQCETPEHHQMDFWRGDWNVSVRSRVAPDKDDWTPPQPGSNHVTSGLNGCVIQEQFTATGGTAGATWSGKSASMWIPSLKKWRQTWVDDSGSYLAFTGGLDNGAITLVGEPAANGNVMRMVYTDITKDHFSWRWESSKDGQKTWRIVMTIEYRRIGLAP